MPRKKTTGDVTKSSTSSIKFAAILAFFRTSPMEIVKFAQELINDAVKERENKGKAVLAGRAKGADAQTAMEQIGGSGASAATTGGGPTGVVPAKRRPGPAKGYRKPQPGAQAATGDRSTATGTGTGAGSASTGEVTDAAALPPQAGSAEGSLDLG